MSYVYARMLISAAGDRYALARYVAAEAGRAGEALFEDRPESIVKIAGELKLSLREKGGEFQMDFEDFAMIHQKGEALMLANQQLEKGAVRMTKDRAIRLLVHAIGREIAERLPIDRKALPREVVEMSRGIRLEEKRAIASENAGSYAWVEKLLTTPIPDVRHRTVNLILAPYLMNVKKLEEDAAVKVIGEYIDRCKLVNPSTNVNESYIRYQCRYSKTKGMRPLAASRAKELLAEMIEFG
jgi:Primase X